MRGLSVEQIVFIIALVLWPIFSLIARARAALRQQQAELAQRVIAEPASEPEPSRVARPRPAAVLRAPPEPPRRRWDRAQLRAAIVAMTVLGRPRGLDP